MDFTGVRGETGFLRCPHLFCRGVIPTAQRNKDCRACVDRERDPSTRVGVLPLPKMEFCSIQACPLVLSDVGAQVLYDLGQSTLKVGVGDYSRTYKVKQKKVMSSFMGTLVELTSASYTIVESGSGTKRTLPLPLMRATAFVKGVPAPYPPLSISEMTETAFLPEKSQSLPEPPTPLPFQALTRDDFVSEEEWEAYEGANAALRSNGQDVAGEAGEDAAGEAGEDEAGEAGEDETGEAGEAGEAGEVTEWITELRGLKVL